MRQSELLACGVELTHMVVLAQLSSRSDSIVITDLSRFAVVVSDLVSVWNLSVLGASHVQSNHDRLGDDLRYIFLLYHNRRPSPRGSLGLRLGTADEVSV